MERRVLFGALICLVLGSVTCQRARFRGTPDGSDTVDPSSVLSIADRNKISETKAGLPPPRTPLTLRPLPESELRQIVTEVNKNITTLEENRRRRPLTVRGPPVPFGPHLRTSERAREIGSIGRSFVETARRVRDRRPLTGGREPVNSPSETDTRQLLPCPFDSNINCDARAPYRTITGACNNLPNPLWGSSNTPFERSSPSAYDDGFDSPRSRSVLNRPLPLPRVISTNIHTASNKRTLDRRFTQITMEFGQYVSHDIERFAAITEPNGEELVCCQGQTPDTTRFGCFPIDIPANDPFFGKFNRRCMEMVRALATPNLRCKIGAREQLNQESAYLDGSAVYGSTVDLANELRLFIGGLLKTTDSPDGELLLQDPTLKHPLCRSQSRRQCFRAGDERVNQQPALMSMHTLWLREHNRVARALNKINRHWNDEKIYQEARKIVSAEFQHVVYNEFLPVLIGEDVARAFDFPAKRNGYNSDYDAGINPQVRSAFSSAAYRVGHTLVQLLVSESQKLKFEDHFLRPDVLYQARQGPSSIIRSLFMDRQQKCDRLISPQLTNTLFEQDPGTGIDLAATNIQRGRDFGTPSYNVFRVLCGLPPARNFRARRGGLVDHTRGAARLLEKTYDHVDDIDLWTGGISEKVLRGAVIGPTLACVIGRQFFLLKKGDRFFYENDDKYAKFPLNQLDEIRKTSLSRIICDNTKTNSVQRLAFRYPDRFRNPTTPCGSLPKVDLSKWGSGNGCVDGGWSDWTKQTTCLSGFKFQFRFCDNPTPSRCGKPCSGFSFRWKRCGRTRSSAADAAEVARRYAPKGVVI